MTAVLLAFASGVLLLQVQAVLPAPGWAWLGLLGALPCVGRRLRWLALPAALLVGWGRRPRTNSAPDPVRAANEGTVIGDPSDGMVRVELGVPKGREGAAALGVWIDRERSALARMRDSLAQADAQIAAAEQTMRQAQQTTTAPAGTPSTPKRAIGGPPADPIGQQANSAATLNQLYGLRRSLLARIMRTEIVP